jgi:hypothetical protein
VNPIFSHTISLFPAWSARAAKSSLSSKSGSTLAEFAFVLSSTSEEDGVRSLVGLGKALIREPGDLYGASPCVSLFYVNSLSRR